MPKGMGIYLIFPQGYLLSYYNQPTVANKYNWLVVSTPLKNISQHGNLPQIGVKIKNI